MKYLFLLFVVSNLSYAGEVRTEMPDYFQLHKPYLAASCLDAQNQHEMDECGKKSLKKATTKMIRILQTLKKNHKSSEPGLLDAITRSQVSWDEYKKTTCHVETYYSRGGTGFDSIWNACLEAKTNERISFLNWIVDNP